MNARKIVYCVEKINHVYNAYLMIDQFNKIANVLLGIMMMKLTFNAKVFK